MIESRRAPRRPVKQGAWIFPGGGAPLIRCMMLDLSVGGARLKVEHDTKLPPEFILILSRDGRLNRHCRIAWRNDDTLGVKFLAQQSVKPKVKPEKPGGLAMQGPEDAWADDKTVAQAVAPESSP